MSLLPPGAKLGRFRITKVIGQGAMGVVYLADDPEIERPVAIKTVRPEALSGESAAEIEGRFLKEAKLAGRLQHPNIVTVYDVGRDHGVCFIAMEYVDGKPLTRYIGASDDLPLTARVGIIRQVAEALAHAHERGVLHRDIKPGNILVARDGRVKVTDFGIGKFTSAATSELTRTGQMIGSPAYMSPEQVRGERVDGRSDLFSLGVVLYELLTGSRPFPGESITTLVYQILHTEPRDPCELKANLPISTREVMARLLAKQTDKRPADAREFIRELKRIEKFQRESEVTRRGVVAAAPTAIRAPAAASAPSAPPVPPLASASALETQPAKPPRRVALAAIALAAIVAAGVFLLRQKRAPPSIVPAASTPAPMAVPAAPTTAPAPAPTSAPAATPMTLPTPGPKEAAAASVGEPRAVRPTGLAARMPTAHPAHSPPKAEAAAEPPRESGKPDRVDAVYSTRRSVRFTSSPDQARLTVDGRYVGIADDWDNRGGGRAFEFEKSGAHYVRMELPGYRTKTFEVDVAPSAGDSVSIDEELERDQRVPYEKLSSVYDQTTGAVEFAVDPPDAVVAEHGKPLGAAASFGPGSPLKLAGPAVHDLSLSAPGRRTKAVRILVSGNAGQDRAKVSEKLKAE